MACYRKEVDCKDSKKRELYEYELEDEGERLLLVVWQKREAEALCEDGDRVLGRYLKVRNIGGVFSLESDAMSSFNFK